MTSKARMSIQWNDRGIAGYVDQFHPGEFLGDCKNVVSSHLVLTPRGKVHGTAHFQKTVKGRRAVLDYVPFRQKNISEGMDVGEFHLLFSDSDRTKLLSAEWKEERQELPREVAVFQVQYRPEPLAKYVFRPRAQTTKKLRPVTERPGQRDFRQQLRIAYGDRCTLTGCSIGLALDGAHIDPFHGNSSDNPQNGLLLRKDLHCLFDAGLIAIDPATKRAWFAPEVRADPQYRQMHKKLRLRAPEREFESHSPDQAALVRRFNRFIQTFGRR